MPDAFSNGVSYAQLTTEMDGLMQSLHALLSELSHNNMCIAQEVCYKLHALVCSSMHVSIACTQ